MVKQLAKQGSAIALSFNTLMFQCFDYQSIYLIKNANEFQIIITTDKSISSVFISIWSLAFS